MTRARSKNPRKPRKRKPRVTQLTHKPSYHQICKGIARTCYFCHQPIEVGEQICWTNVRRGKNARGGESLGGWICLVCTTCECPSEVIIRTIHSSTPEPEPRSGKHPYPALPSRG